MRWAAGDSFEQRFADFGSALAAVLHQKQQQLAHTLEVRSIFNNASPALLCDEIAPRQNCQMRRHGVLNNSEFLANLTRRKTFRRDANQQPECVEPCFLTQGRQRLEG